ncbi:hypothetical protein CK203_113482 [Vitis vinifera]|uniref:Retrotransposon gag domain-containing protein n=1 Tax=Vitis vinifera TaxID=29760 RepID=A0A438C8F1_VITVI|nr:hypothetical protein CK203_113482 [Vitis vinifera]
MAFGRQLHQAEGQFRTLRNWNSNVRNLKWMAAVAFAVKSNMGKDEEGRLVRIENPQDTELDICVNIMDPPPEDQNSQQGQGAGYKAPYSAPLTNFHGMESENPYAHIKEFEENFLKKNFPTHRTNGLKRQISNFSAKENEKFHECWERYMEAINAYPHHGFDTWLLRGQSYNHFEEWEGVDQPLPNMGHDEELMSKRPLIKESNNQEEKSGKKSASKSSIEEEPRIVIKRI